MQLRNFVCLIAVLTMVSFANADRVTLEDLILPGESCWNGSDESGGFNSGVPTLAIAITLPGKRGTVFHTRI